VNRLGQANRFADSAADAGFAVNGVNQRHCLSVFYARRGSAIQSTVEFIHSHNRADFGTLAAAGAFVRVYVTWIVDKVGSEIACFAFNRFQFSIGDDIDI